jgi:glucose-1-phosphate thymidylyltransferase
VRVGARFDRFVCVHGRGVILVHSPVSSRGPWLDATRAPSLQRIANRPILCHVLDALVAAGVRELAVLTPPDLLQDIATCIEEEGPSQAEVSYLVHDPDADPAGALRAIAAFAGRAPTIVHHSHGLLDQPLGPFLELLDGDSPDVVLLLAQGARNAEPLGPATQRMLRVAELDPANAALEMAGVCMLGPGALDALGGSEERIAAHLRGPETALGEGGLELGGLVESLIAREVGRLQVRVVREWRAFAGNALDLLDMNRAVLDGLESQVPALQRDGNRFEGRVFIDPTATVTSSVICGPVIIGAGACVADSYIGPHTSIGAGVHVEGAEIERSIVFAGASILHVGGRLVASVVGREARVFRDFSVPRAMRLQVGDGNEVALC